MVRRGVYINRSKSMTFAVELCTIGGAAARGTALIALLAQRSAATATACSRCVGTAAGALQLASCSDRTSDTLARHIFATSSARRAAGSRGC